MKVGDLVRVYAVGGKPLGIDVITRIHKRRNDRGYHDTHVKVLGFRGLISSSRVQLLSLA